MRFKRSRFAWYTSSSVCSQSANAVRKPPSPLPPRQALDTETSGRESMTDRPGRNQPCPCGSGKKYKKCHGAVINAPAVVQPEGPDRPITPAMPPATETFSLDVTGFPGQQQHWVLVNKFKPEIRKPSSPAGHQGEYRVVYVF